MEEKGKNRWSDQTNMIEGKSNEVSIDNATWIGSIKKSNDVTNETKLQPLSDPLETNIEPAQSINRTPK